MSEPATSQPQAQPSDPAAPAPGILAGGGNPPTPAADPATATPTPAAPAAPATPAAPAGAPESYAPFQMPEGRTFEEAQLTAFQTLAKENNLSQEAAQKFVAFGATLVDRVETQYREAYQKQQGEWIAEAKADRELLGADGKSFDRNVGIAKSAVDKLFGDAAPQMLKLLDAYGLTNHPDVLRAFYRAGLRMIEDRPGGLLGGSSSPGAPANDPARILYPGMTPTVQ